MWFKSEFYLKTIMKKRIFAALALITLFACAESSVEPNKQLPEPEPKPEPVYDCIQESNVTKSETTLVAITIPSKDIAIDPMIYGQMLEDCNDKVIYGGVVNNEGEENMAVTELLRPLNIPVMRWPAGTAIYTYEWKRGIGPTRTPGYDYWGGNGKEYYTFGTEEFITWCERLNIEPYINLPMNLDPYKNRSTYDHSFENALAWIEYVNGDVTTPYGAQRAENGHPEPYSVKLWCIGNENYYPHAYHTPEPAEFYAKNLATWAKKFKELYPDLSLLGVGRTPDWTKVILEESGEYIDYVTIHYYIQSYIDKNNLLTEPHKGLFTSALVEANLKQNIEVLKAANAKLGREANPIRFSVDEWNHRHKPETSAWNTDRKDDRRQYDVITTSTMLNVFLRNAPYVGMANYIFPVNGHGLLKTVGENDAYRTAAYYVFELYRKYLVGDLMGVYVEGAGHPMVRLGDYAWLDGDVVENTKSIVQDLCFVDAVATMNDNGDICIALSNRSHDKSQKVKLDLPDGYSVAEVWSLESQDIKAVNTAANRNAVQPKLIENSGTALSLLPCGLKIVKCIANQQ